MTQKPTNRKPVPIGSSTPGRRRGDAKPLVFCQTTGAVDFLRPENGDRRFCVISDEEAEARTFDQADLSALKEFITKQQDVLHQSWRDTEPDLAYAVVQADQKSDPLADLVVAALSLFGVCMLLAWLWWASHGGKWVAPW